MERDIVTRARILVVDDQASNVALLDDLLEQAGYTHVRGVTDPARRRRPSPSSGRTWYCWTW